MRILGILGTLAHFRHFFTCPFAFICLPCSSSRWYRGG